MSELSEELADLVEALREASAEHAWMAEAVSAATESAGHTAECRACPICQGLSVLRQVRPEAVEHLTMAVDQLALALRALLSPSGQAPSARSGPAPGPAARGPSQASPATARIERIEIEP